MKPTPVQVCDLVQSLLVTILACPVSQHALEQCAEIACNCVSSVHAASLGRHCKAYMLIA